jgi:anti-sigma B factor antagonist
MDVLIERTAHIVVARPIVKHLDLSNADSVRNEILEGLEECNKLIVAMGRVKFIDSRGCGAIISCLKHVSAKGGDLKMCEVNSEVRSVLELIRLHRICEITDTCEEAVASFEASN